MTSFTNKLWSNVRRLLGRPYRMADDFAERLLARHFSTERYQWPHHVVFIAGLPKSGTTWMAQLIDAVPGYKFRRPQDPDNCVSNHDVCNAVFAGLPWDLYSVVKLHTRATPANLAVIGKYNLRTVVMYRDPRDQCVSRYFHVLAEPNHRHHQFYNEVSKEESLMHCLEITVEESIPWIRDWLSTIMQHPDRFHVVRYEDLHADAVAVLMRILDFYGIHVPVKQATAILERIAAKTKFDLQANLRWGKGTARKGIVGDWRNHFSEGHVQRFKEACGKFLIELGYERDMSWTGRSVP